ncbi:hypothetical protein CPU12_13570 [Malaciobacter molluscorum LMG 25693]|uniref:Uncharacterized protein n=1 Tax=Malaciobacter molluscorum LMG 25693 TaxID=870501 RepID=A0A2G1DEB1_9BACT|nr:hypothetical protein [Malaciobacter molluscorum]AXX91159.1 hypothetical protein AMOL_0120 [Malaciobacter molluscorum LMG 25693]PHO16842.1 hypothetical protein CPU12_13570 [Malaciobacter molluscorum LMG 25693]
MSQVENVINSNLEMIATIKTELKNRQFDQAAQLFIDNNLSFEEFIKVEDLNDEDFVQLASKLIQKSL